MKIIIKLKKYLLKIQYLCINKVYNHIQNDTETGSQLHSNSISFQHEKTQ